MNRERTRPSADRPSLQRRSYQDHVWSSTARRAANSRQHQGKCGSFVCSASERADSASPSRRQLVQAAVVLTGLSLTQGTDRNICDLLFGLSNGLRPFFDVQCSQPKQICSVTWSKAMLDRYALYSAAVHWLLQQQPLAHVPSNSLKPHIQSVRPCNLIDTCLLSQHSYQPTSSFIQQTTNRYAALC